MKKLILIIAVAFASCNSNQKTCDCQKQIDSLNNAVTDFYYRTDSLQWQIIDNQKWAIERFGKQNEMNNLIIQNM